MKKNLAIKVGKSKALAEFVRQLLLDAGAIDRGRSIIQSLSPHRDEHLLHYGPGEQMLHDTLPSQDRYDILDPATQLGEIMERLVTPPVEIELNEKYTAVVSPDRKTVTVGCQTFKAEKILEVAEALKS